MGQDGALNVQIFKLNLVRWEDLQYHANIRFRLMGKSQQSLVNLNPTGGWPRSR